MTNRITIERDTFRRTLNRIRFTLSLWGGRVGCEECGDHRFGGCCRITLAHAWEIAGCMYGGRVYR